MLPFLKWPGGKRWFINSCAALLPSHFDRYIEPFLGSGSMFFFLCPKRAILGDINAELVTVFAAVRDDPNGVMKRLINHERLHSSEHYYSVRRSRPRLSVAKASRLIYLNRTCFNGLYRVNCSGEFNVPIGSRTTVVYDTDDFAAISKVLSNADIRHSDFEPVINEARYGDFVFADPPYTIRHNTNGFLKYNGRLFSWDDQVRLARALGRAKKRGARILLTNANHASVRELYQDGGFISRCVERFSSVSGSTCGRKRCSEAIIRSW